MIMTERVFFTSTYETLSRHFDGDSVKRISDFLENRRGKRVVLSISADNIRSLAQNSLFHLWMDYLEKTQFYPRGEAKRIFLEKYMDFVTPTQAVTISTPEGKVKVIRLMYTENYGWTEYHSSFLSVDQMHQLMQIGFDDHAMDGVHLPIRQDLEEIVEIRK